MPDFTRFLPPEICSIILSHVNQLECIELLTVCRRWYKLIPQYGTNVWKELEISEASWSTYNNTMLKCLGMHVKKVSIVSPKNSGMILRRLESQGCNIQSLEIRDILEKSSLPLERSTLYNEIGLYRRTLKELFLNGRCLPYCLLPTLLNVLPALTHLAIELKNQASYPAPAWNKRVNDEILRDIQSNNDDNSDSYNLVFLSLASGFRYGYHTEQIIKRCPRLKYLLASRFAIFDHQKRTTIDFARILELCPSLRYIHWGEDYITSNIEKEWLTLSREKKRIADSENGSDHQEGESCHLRRVEFRDNDEQRYISALKACLQDPSLLEHLRLCGFFDIDLHQVWNSFAKRNSNLLSQPPQLKTLELFHFNIAHRTGNDISFEGFFNYFQHVERLELSFHLSRTSDFGAPSHYMRKVLEAMGHQSHQLRYLSLSVPTNVFMDYNVVFWNKLYIAVCRGNPKLETLQLYNGPMSNAMLLDLCSHPNLHTLNLSGQDLHTQLTKEGWVSFACKLKEQEQGSCSGGRIRSIELSCGYCENVTDEVLEELAGVKSLETLRILFNKTITDAGVYKFASIKNSISKEHKKIELYYCNNVSTDNPHVVLAPPPSIDRSMSFIFELLYDE